ncbi:hypothetical protein CVT26_006060 [Gymnopilus dilepis]|uniref:F-box domain-containing protein n=1 Tax=Gymnopilus dilepis TaxID=231916 RepID=A0A409Y1P4_9AGAR|nr:hypothetical protein CVT26_006060 [Gymnopilus dilepis]
MGGSQSSTTTDVSPPDVGHDGVDELARSFGGSQSQGVQNLLGSSRQRVTEEHTGETTTSSLLTMPPEILVHIICLLPLFDITTLQLVDRHLQNIIQTSIDVRYHIALISSSMTDNPADPTPLVQRLQKLEEREAAWRAVKPRFRKVINVPNHGSRYQLLAGYLFLGDFERKVVHFLKLPSREEEEVRWRNIMVAEAVVEFCPLVEYDLIAIMTTFVSLYSASFSSFIKLTSNFYELLRTPRIQNGTTEYCFEVALYQLSTGQPHPLAKEHRMFVTTSTMENPTVYIRIVGELLVPIFSFGDTDEEDLIFIFNWMTGELNANWATDHGSCATCLFLSEDLLMIPSKTTHSLNIFKVTSGKLSTPPKPLLTLKLPRLARGQTLRYIFPRIKPDPLTSPPLPTFAVPLPGDPDHGQPESKSPPGKSFYANEAEAISVMQLIIEGRWGNAIITFVWQIEAVRDLARRYYAKIQEGGVMNKTGVLEYCNWGPPVTRWFSTTNYANAWVAASWGQRFVQFKHGRHGVPLLVMDFNPERVREWQRNSKQGEKGNGLGQWCVTLPEDLDALGMFSEPVEGELPYVATATQEIYKFDGLMMDDERLLGVKDNPQSGGIASIEVLYFG